MSGVIFLVIDPSLNNLALAILIQKELGFGCLSIKKGVNGYLLIIDNILGLFLVVLNR